MENTIKAQVQSANAALTKRVAKEALKLLDLISTGGEYSFLGQSFDVLGLERAERILAQAKAELPAGSPERAELDRVIAFGKLARENLSFSDEVLAVVGEPIRVKATALNGGNTSLTSFAVALAVAVSLMFITLLLAAGTLALEREENAFSRLVRGLVSKTGPARREGGSRGRLLRLRLPADDGRAGAVRGARLGALPALARGPGGGRARVRRARACDRGAHARRPGGVAARVHALPAAGVPRAGAVGRRGAGAVRRDPRGVRGHSPSSPPSTPSTRRSTTPATSAARCCTWPA